MLDIIIDTDMRLYLCNYLPMILKIIISLDKILCNDYFIMNNCKYDKKDYLYIMY